MPEREWIRITHLPSNEVIAAGPRGWGITSFEGNYYIQSRYLRRLDGQSAVMVSANPQYRGYYLWRRPYSTDQNPGTGL